MGDEWTHWRRGRPVFALIALTLMLSGCSSVKFYRQAVTGQVSLLAARTPIETVIDNPETPTDVREKLSLARDIRSFAGAELGLPVGDAYATYVDTGRDFVVWNVFAAPELSVTLRAFCFPVAGCVSYRGYFAKKDAMEEAARLRSEGLDVYVGGVAAYSTLGWFDDPILNTFLRRSDVRFAALLFHELAHRAVYVADDTTFNESFATAVERAALSRWLQSRGASDIFAEYLADEAAEQQVIELIAGARTSLDAVYSSDLTDAEKRIEKEAVIARLRTDYASLGAGATFRAWMQTPINNAKLGTVAAYHQWVAAFTGMLADADGDFDQFIAAVRKLAEQERVQRDAFLVEQDNAD